MNATILHVSDNALTLCHPFGLVPSSHIHSIAQELADLRLVMGKIRTELALKQGSPTPARNGDGSYAAFDEVERVLILELQAYADSGSWSSAGRSPSFRSPTRRRLRDCSGGSLWLIVVTKRLILTRNA